MVDKFETEESRDIYEVFSQVSLRDLERAEYPLLTYASKKLFVSQDEDPFQHKVEFWKELFERERFFRRDGTPNGYNPREHFLFVLHSFDSPEGLVFKAITTDLSLFMDDSGNMINYDHHGRPCEQRGQGSYPTVLFWKEFYDMLSEDDMDKYPVPDRNWRKAFYTK